MEAEAAIDTDAMMEKISLQIDPKRARFPCCIVWTPLPVISWLVPFIGHIGICREDGVILDFAGPNFVCVDNFAFGAVARYIQMNNGKIETEKEISWDDALRMGTQEFQHRSYNLFTCNCHSFVANNLNRMFCSGCNKWNVVNLATLIFLKGRWVNKASIVRSFLPFVIVLCLGLLLGGWTFLIGLVSFAFTLVGMQWPKSPAQISPIYKRSMRLTPFPVVFYNDETCACSTKPSPLRLSVLPISVTGPATNLHCNHRNQKLKGFSSSSQGVWERRASGLEACNNLGVHKISRRYVCSPHHSP